MIPTDEIIMEWSWKGFTDELFGTSSTESEDSILNKAYKLGSLHAWAGEVDKSFDKLSNEEILILIKTE